MSRCNDDLHLIRMAEAHLANTHRWLNRSDELRRQVDCSEAPTEEGNRNHWHARWRDDSREDYAIVTHGGRHIGNCGLRDIDRQRRKAQLWIYLGESYGIGYGTSAVRQLLARAFHGLGLNRIYLRVIAENIRAEKFYLKLGFVREGILRQDTVHEGGYVDSIVMGLLADEFRRIQQTQENAGSCEPLPFPGES